MVVSRSFGGSTAGGRLGAIPPLVIPAAAVQTLMTANATGWAVARKTVPLVADLRGFAAASSAGEDNGRGEAIALRSLKKGVIQVVVGAALFKSPPI